MLWIELAQNTHIQRNFVNNVMKLQGSIKFDEFLDWLGVSCIIKRGQSIFVLSKLTQNVKFWLKLVKDIQIQLLQINS